VAVPREEGGTAGSQKKRGRGRGAFRRKVNDRSDERKLLSTNEDTLCHAQSMDASRVHLRSKGEGGRSDLLWLCVHTRGCVHIIGGCCFV
jgi:hypothetical protein